MQDCRVEINGVKVFPFKSKDELFEYVNTQKGILVAINSGKIHKATDETRQIINNGIGYVDGVGAQYALKKKGYPDVVKIAGCELWLDIIERTYREGKSYYFIGGKQTVIDTTINKLQKDFPGIRIAGYRDGYLKEGDKENLILDIVEKRPDYVFVAMGSPKQELLMGEIFEKHKAVYQGLGGSFDLYIGNTKRAPQWLIDHGIEGAYRVMTDFNKARVIRFKDDLLFLIKVFMGRY